MKKIGLLFLCFFSLLSFDVRALGFEQNFNVRVGIFDAAEVVISYENKNDLYDISAKVKTANFFGGIYPFLGVYKARGKVLKNGVLPTVYDTKTESRSNIRTKKILYQDGIAYKRISSKNDKTNEVSINNIPKTVNASDLQTVFAELINNFSKKRDCALLREIYDGKKHYKVIAENKGVENRWFDYMNKAQNAYKCSVYIENLKQNNDNILWEISAETPINLWLDVKKDGNMPKILEISIDSTPLGGVQVTPIDYN